MPKKKPEQPSLRGYYAGYASRLLAIIIDVLVLAVILAISAILWFVLIESVNYVWNLVIGGSINTNNLRIYLLVFVPYFTLAIYYIFLWTTIGTSVGGIIVGTRVVDEKGRNPSLFKSMIRFIFEFVIPFFGIFGSLWIFFGNQRRALFDRIANTYVIYNWDARPEEIFLNQATENLYGDQIMQLLANEMKEKFE